MIKIKACFLIISNVHQPVLRGCCLGDFTYILGMAKLSEIDFLGTKGGGTSSV